MKREYNTEQKRMITDYLKTHGDRHFTVEEISEAVGRQGAGKSTVYRQISKLLEAGVIRRFESPSSSSFVYQYAGANEDCCRHYHLKCVKCGRLIHMKCERLDEVREHIIRDHDFIIGYGSSVIYGECTSCASEAKTGD